MCRLDGFCRITQRGDVYRNFPVDTNFEVTFKEEVAPLNDQVDSISTRLTLARLQELVQAFEYSFQFAFLSEIQAGKAAQNTRPDGLPDHRLVTNQKHGCHDQRKSQVEHPGQIVFNSHSRSNFGY